METAYYPLMAVAPIAPFTAIALESFYTISTKSKDLSATKSHSHLSVLLVISFIRQSHATEMIVKDYTHLFTALFVTMERYIKTKISNTSCKEIHNFARHARE